MKIKTKMTALLCALTLAGTIAVPTAFAADKQSDIVSSGVDTSVSKLLGDANLNGEVDIADATVIQRYDASMIELGEAALKLADVNRDGEVSIVDATFIQRYMLSLPCPQGIGEPIDDNAVIEHKLVSKVQAYQWDYEAEEWNISYTKTFEYENAYPVLIDTIENYEDAEHIHQTFAYTFDGDLPLTRTETTAETDSVITVEYNKGRVYNMRSGSTNSGSYMTEKYQYGHDDEYFTLVLHEGYAEGNEYTLGEWKEEADSISVTTENGLLKRTTNTGIYAKWIEGNEKNWVRFRGIYSIDYDADGIASLMSAVYSDIGYDLQDHYEVVKENGKITEIIRYTYDESWQPFERYEFEYNDTEISPARYSLMINDFIGNHGGNYYIFNWY